MNTFGSIVFRYITLTLTMYVMYVCQGDVNHGQHLSPTAGGGALQQIILTHSHQTD